MLADLPVLREIIKMYLSLNRDTLITFLSFVVTVACLYLSCMSSVMIIFYFDFTRWGLGVRVTFSCDVQNILRFYDPPDTLGKISTPLDI